jgi:hypothetical protein
MAEHSYVPLSLLGKLNKAASADLGAKSAAYLLEAMTTPGQNSKLAFNIAFGTSEPMYTWMQDLQNRVPADRFSVAMTGAEPAENILQGESNFLAVASPSVE